MKILTKKWVEKHEQVRLVHCFKEFDSQKTTYEEIKRLSKSNFYNDIAKDDELNKLCLKTNMGDILYNAKIKRNKNTLLSLPKEVYENIKDINSVILGYANKEDKEFLNYYADKLLSEIEKEAEEARRITEIAEDYLPCGFMLDEIIGELVYEEYLIGKDYFINIGGLIICVEDYLIIEREDFKINKWDIDNPLSLWTALEAVELHYISEKCYELHLLLVNGDELENKTYWYFTLRGTNIKIVK